MLPELSTSAEKVLMLPQLTIVSLISIGQLCGDGCNVLLNERKLYTVKRNQIILEGDRNSTDGLWDIPIYKTKFSSQNYELSTIHPGMYKSRQPVRYKQKFYRNKVICKVNTISIPSIDELIKENSSKTLRLPEKNHVQVLLSL